MFTPPSCETQEKFSFLEENGYTRIAGLSTILKGMVIIKPCPVKKLPHPFQVKAIYERNEVVFEIAYTSSDGILTSQYCYEGRDYSLIGAAYQFIPFDIRPEKFIEHSFAVNDLEAFKEYLSTLAGVILPDMYLFNSNRIEVRRENMRVQSFYRDKLLEYERQDLEKDRLTKILIQANQAFLERDYKRVIECLFPIEKSLSPSDLKKLELARKKLFDPL